MGRECDHLPYAAAVGERCASFRSYRARK